MKKVITYGTYDLLHQGHINLLKRARELGDYLIVGVTTDTFDLERGKLNVKDGVMERVDAVKATGLADKVIIEEYKGQKIDDIQRYGVDVFAIGSDWEGKFDYLKEYCEVVYLPRTEGISSTQLRQEEASIRLGVVGTGSIAGRFMSEIVHINRVSVTNAYNPYKEDECEEFCKKHEIVHSRSYEDMLQDVDAVYVASPPLTHYDYARMALEHNKHVLCETPFVLSEQQARELYDMAEARHLTLMVALKTAFCPAFGHLVTLLKSGVIGETVDINASVTTLTPEDSPKLNSTMAGGSMNENACFPMLAVFKLFGHEYENVRFCSKMKNGVDVFTKTFIQYKHAIATFQVGLGVKSEGNMVISGTKGYIYVPAPWWKTEYFEVRYENQNLNRRYFYPYDEEGLRYEIKAFVSAILGFGNSDYKLSKEDNIHMARLQELYIKSADSIIKI